MGIPRTENWCKQVYTSREPSVGVTSIQAFELPLSPQFVSKAQPRHSCYFASLFPGKSLMDRMLWQSAQVASLGVLSWALLTPPIRAQFDVTSDNSIGTVVNYSAGTYTITGGQLQQGNTTLLHSFDDFSLNTSTETIHFDLGHASYAGTTNGVTTVIGRTTGGTPSTLNGQLKLTGGNTPNLFLINPSGIVFGADASLNVPGSVVVSTAESVLFSNGVRFGVDGTTPAPLLTVSTPVGLQMGQNPAAITVQGVTSGAQLQVPSGSTLALLGGDVFISGRTLSTPQGRIEVGSVGSGSVSLTPNSQGFSLGYDNAQSFRNISLSNQALLTTGGNGEIHLWGADIALSGGSRASLQNNTNVNTSGKVSLHASGLISITGDNASGSTTSAVRAGALGTGMVGNIEIFTQDLLASDGGIILTSNISSSTGGGNITVNASGTIQVAGVGKTPSNRSGLSGLTFGSGKGGDINVSTLRLSILDGAVVTTSAAFGTGAAGNVTVNARESIHVAGVETVSTSFAPSSLSSSTLTGGNSGNLAVNTARLSVQTGARVEASSYATGNAGSVTINASEFVEVAGRPVQSFLIPSFVGSSTVQQAGSSRVLAGNSADVTITTQQLRVSDSGLINVRNDGTGNAGTVRINANTVLLNTQGAITATTLMGEGGNIAVNAAAFIMRHNSTVTATSGGTGNGGNITLNAAAIAGFENSDIIANAVQGRGGNIQIMTQGIFGLQFRPQLTPDNDITASSQLGINGTVSISTPGIDVGSSLVELPTDLSNSSQQISGGCAANSGNSFMATGRGGIPMNPSEGISRDRTWGDIRDLSAFMAQTPVVAPDLTANEPPQAIVEISSWRVNSAGQVELIAAPSDVMLANTYATCSG